MCIMILGKGVHRDVTKFNFPDVFNISTNVDISFYFYYENLFISEISVKHVEVNKKQKMKPLICIAL